MSALLRQGKLPPVLLSRLLASFPAGAALVGPRPGEDAAVVAAPEDLLVVTSDPITFCVADLGRSAVQVNANDIAAMGAEPRWMLATVLLPVGAPEEEIGALMRSLTEACAAADIELIGGHTEVTDAVRRTIIAATMVGSVQRERLVTSAGARPGDVVLLSKPIAIEGTAVLAREAENALLAEGLPGDVLERARLVFEDPGISVLPESRILCAGRLPHALHDVTEGGVATALREMAEVSGVGMRIDRAAIPILPECERICSLLRLDPLGLIGSGSLLAAVPQGDAAAVRSVLQGAGFAAAQIGEVTAGMAITLVDADGSSSPLPSFDRDELARYLEERAP